jgi:molybdopterin/thiamine biosynthesis adenylyltransferase
MNVRISEKHWREIERLTSLSFVEGLEFAPETGCILLVAENDHRLRPCLLVAEVLEPETGDLLEQGSGGITFASRFLRRALLRVRERGLKGFLTLHSHPMADKRVSFSLFDDANDPELMANFYEIEPAGIFGSVVLGRDAICARLWRDGAPVYLQQLVCVGEQLSFRELSGKAAKEPPKPQAIFDRSSAITGAGAAYCMAQFRIAVVGTSGTGSLMVELLARAGAGEIVLFEFDAADETNLNRVLHLRQCDVDTKGRKADRLREAIRETGLPTEITVIRGGDIRDAAVADELRGCDLLVGCVDRDWPRLILCEVAQQYLIPYLDLGSEIGASANEIQSLDARVSYIGPERPCLKCAKIISEEQIRLEGYGETERARVVGMGYSRDLALRAPSVMDLNMRAASMAMLWIRHLLQPFLKAPLPHALKETVTNFATKEVYYTRNPECRVCGEPLRAASGGRFRLTTRQKKENSGSDRGQSGAVEGQRIEITL